MNMQDWEPPAGEITEVVGRLSSGRTSLCARWLAAATSRDGVVALVDTDHTLDPPSAERAGVDLRRLLWIRCRSRRDLALAVTDALVRCPGFSLVVLDTGEIPPRLGVTAAFRLKLAVRRSDVALVVLTRRRISGPAATVALETVQDGLDWTATGSRLVALRTSLHRVRPHAACHPATFREAAAVGGEPLRAASRPCDQGDAVIWRWSA